MTEDEAVSISYADYDFYQNTYHGDAFSSQAGRIDEIADTINELNESMTRLNNLAQNI